MQNVNRIHFSKEGLGVPFVIFTLVQFISSWEFQGIAIFTKHLLHYFLTNSVTLVGLFHITVQHLLQKYLGGYWYKILFKYSCKYLHGYFAKLMCE